MRCALKVWLAEALVLCLLFAIALMGLNMLRHMALLVTR